MTAERQAVLAELESDDLFQRCLAAIWLILNPPPKQPADLSLEGDA